MEHKYYTIDQVADLLGMHHKTIRKFITEKRLGASKVGKQWRISGHDLSVFLESDTTHSHMQTGEDSNGIKEEEGIKYEFTAEGKHLEKNRLEENPRRVGVSAVADISGTDKNEYLRISNTLIAIANTREPNQERTAIQIKYDEKEQRIKVILWGSISYIENMLESISMLLEQNID